MKTLTFVWLLLLPIATAAPQGSTEEDTEEVVEEAETGSNADRDCQPSQLEQLCQKLSNNDVLEAMMEVGRVLKIIEGKSELKEVADTEEMAASKSLDAEEQGKANDRELAGVKGRGPRPRPNLRGNKYTTRKKNGPGETSQPEACFGLKFLYAAKAMDSFGEVDAEVFLELLADVQGLEDGIIDGITSITYSCVDSSYEDATGVEPDNTLVGEASKKCNSADKFVGCLHNGMTKQLCASIKGSNKRKGRRGNGRRNQQRSGRCNRN